jgi:hypothetical protein
MEATRILSHQDVDRRILRLVAACIERIDKDPGMLDRARTQVTRYTAQLQEEWNKLLALPWPELRSILLEESHEGDRIRQSVPFGGFLGTEERMKILRSS